MRPAHLGDRGQQRLAIAEQLGAAGAFRRQREEQVLGGDVLVAEGGHLLLGPLQGAGELRGEGLTSGAPPRSASAGPRFAPSALLDLADVAPRLAQDRHDEPALLAQEGEQQVDGRDLRGCLSAASRWAAATASL